MIIYGGSFNPITKAHKKIIKKIEKKLNDDVYILPTSKKNYPHKKNLIDDNHRIEMIKLTVNNKILKDEIEDSNYKGTYEILKKYNFPYFILGEDNLKNIDKWMNIEGLIKNAKFIVITRDNNNLKLPNKNSIKIKIKSNISSTKARKTINKKENKKYLVKKVREYIKENNLYR